MKNEILCNKCGESCWLFCDTEKTQGDPYGLINATVSGGYASEALQDQHKYQFSICENCLAELFSFFKIKVSDIDYFI